MTGKNIGHVRADKPPSEHAMACLASIASRKEKGSPAQEYNFTVRDKLLQHGYVEMRDAPSPYKTHKPGHRVNFLFVTEAGQAALKR